MSHAPANGVAILALGLSSSTSPFGPLPLVLDGLGVTGCSLLTSSEFLDARFTDGLGNAADPVAIPFSAAAVGVHIYSQYVAWAPSANVLGLTFSNGVHLEIGN